MFRQYDTPAPAHSGLIAFAGLADCRVSLATFEVTLLNRDERVCRDHAVSHRAFGRSRHQPTDPCVDFLDSCAPGTGAGEPPLLAAEQHDIGWWTGRRRRLSTRIPAARTFPKSRIGTADVGGEALMAAAACGRHSFAVLAPWRRDLPTLHRSSPHRRSRRAGGARCIWRRRRPDRGRVVGIRVSTPRSVEKRQRSWRSATRYRWPCAAS